jgi:hypothetical protein
VAANGVDLPLQSEAKMPLGPELCKCVGPVVGLSLSGNFVYFLPESPGAGMLADDAFGLGFCVTRHGTDAVDRSFLHKTASLCSSVPRPGTCVRIAIRVEWTDSGSAESAHRNMIVSRRKTLDNRGKLTDTKSD